MSLTLTFGGMAALFGAMALLAAVPSVSVLIVSARAAAGSLAHGALAAAGIVAADILFILLALFGLALAADALGGAFHWLKYAAALWLVWLAIGLIRANAAAPAGPAPAAPTPLSSFMAGFLLTLGDQKAILFYLGFFPAFLDLAAMTAADAALIVLIAIVAVGGVKLAWAFAAARAGGIAGAKAGRGLNLAAATALIAVALWLVVAGNASV
ncbi:LysE family transporter [Parvibaculum sp.]|uniref:LysE family transporter n=1 Tax=Parvibaculum sp. TaxID=2024848 RepID=UPI00349FFC4B